MPKKISLDEILSKRAGNVKSTPKGDAINMLVKAAPASWDPASRSARFVMSSETVDRYGDIVMQSGLDTEGFAANPVALLFHDSRCWPIGTWSDITKVMGGRPRRTEGVLNFAPEGTDEDADRAARHVAAGTMRAVSIGFIPHDWEPMYEEGDFTGIRFLASELIECSLVSIPANPDAMARSAAGDEVIFKELLEEVLDNWAKTPEGLIVPRKDYEAAYRTVAAEKTISDHNAKITITVDATDDDGELRKKVEAEIQKIKSGEKSLSEARDALAKRRSTEEGMDPEECGSDGADDPDMEKSSDDCMDKDDDCPDMPDEMEPEEDGCKPKSAESVVIKVDTSEAQKSIAELTSQIEAVDKSAQSLFSRLKDLFGLGEKSTDRIEPVLEIPVETKSEPEPVAAPSAEDVESARLAARMALAGAFAKGLLR